MRRAGVARISDRLVAVSARVKDELVKYKVASPDHISVVEPGLDLAPMLRCRLGARRVSPRARTRFGGAAGGNRRPAGAGKEPPVVFRRRRRGPRGSSGRALRRGGGGEIGPVIRALAQRLGVMTRVTFTGWRYDLPRIYADLDVLVSCSKNEGTPFTIIEAMAAGCPVVGTRVGGVPDLLDDRARGFSSRREDRASRCGGSATAPRSRSCQGSRAIGRGSCGGQVFPARLASDMDTLLQELLHAYDVARATVRSPRHAGRASARHAMGGDRADPGERSVRGNA